VASASFHFQLGDVATWVGGVATAVALILTWLLLRTTVRDQRDARTRQRRAQARLVSAWSGHVAPGSDSSYYTVAVKLQNLSDEPVYGVRGAVGTSWVAEHVPYEELDIIYVIPPKSELSQTVSMQFGQVVGDETPVGNEVALPVEIIFYDAAHKDLWLRDRFGELTQIPDEGAKSAARHFFKNRDSPP
jgi:hypothetical protein